jgi:hypothetical protein
MKKPALALLLAWLLPGAGHWYVGQRGKAVVFCFVLLALFLAGVLITEGGCVDFRFGGVIGSVTGRAEADWGRHPYAFLLQGCAGGPAIVALAATSGRPEYPASKLGDLGMLLTLIAGALNVLLVADALYRSRPLRTEGRAK